MPGKSVLIVVISLLALAGCAMFDSPSTPDTTRDDLAARLAEVQTSQAVALALWDRVIFGEIVSCEEYIPVPEPVALTEQSLAAHASAAAIQGGLNQAVKAVRDSSDLWNIECAEEREFVPLNMAREGRATALAATEPLNEAAALLAAWQ
jgi:hypothetical protein